MWFFKVNVICMNESCVKNCILTPKGRKVGEFDTDEEFVMFEWMVVLCLIDWKLNNSNGSAL